MNLALNCRDRFFQRDKINTSGSRKPVDVHYNLWQTVAVADIFTLTNYTFQRVESLATFTIVIYNMRVLNNVLHPDKIPNSFSRYRVKLILLNDILHPDKIPTSLGESQTTNLSSYFNNIQDVHFDLRLLEAFTAVAHFNPP